MRQEQSQFFAMALLLLCILLAAYFFGFGWHS